MLGIDSQGRTLRRATAVAAAAVAMALGMLTAPAAIAADEVPESLDQSFLGSTPSIVWQNRMPDAGSMGALMRAPSGKLTPAVLNGLPEMRTSKVIGGGAFAVAPGFQSKINAFWADPTVPDYGATAAVNMAAFDTMEQASAAVLADGKVMGVAPTSVAAERGALRWQGVVKGDGFLDRIAWVVTADPSPTVVRVVCTLAGPASLNKRCPIDAVLGLATDVALQTLVSTALDPQVAAALPASPTGLAPVLAVSLPSRAVWAGLSPSKALARAVRSSDSTVIQYATPGASKVGIFLTITPLPNPADATQFIDGICNGTPADERCTSARITKTASGQQVYGALATNRKGGKVIGIGAQAAGKGLLVWADCRDVGRFEPLSAADTRICEASVPALLAAPWETAD